MVYEKYLLLEISRVKRLVLISILMIISILSPIIINAEEKIIIGIVEEVILLPWEIKLPARIDTGASMCSIDVRELKIVDSFAEFRLPENYSGLKLKLKIISWKLIHTSEGREKRPVVEMEICLGPKRLKVHMNLNDRSFMKYPLIIGLNALKEGFIVDPLKFNFSPPCCMENQPK